MARTKLPETETHEGTEAQQISQVAEAAPVAAGAAELDQVGDRLPPLVQVDGLVGPPAQTVSAMTAEEAATIPKPKRYRVVSQQAQVSLNGSMTTIKPGKIIDERYYDVALLKRQGIRLDAIEE